MVRPTLQGIASARRLSDYAIFFQLILLIIFVEIYFFFNFASSSSWLVPEKLRACVENISFFIFCYILFLFVSLSLSLSTSKRDATRGRDKANFRAVRKKDGKMCARILHTHIHTHRERLHTCGTYSFVQDMRLF